MLVPGIRHGLHIPRSVTRLLLAVLVLCGVVAGWAILAPGRVSTDGPALPYTSIGNIRSIAYIEPRDGRDHVMVRSSAEGSEPVSLYSLDIAISGLHARGLVSPDAARIALLNSGTTVSARMTLLQLSGSAPTPVFAEGTFDHLSRLAWSPDSQRITAVRTTIGAEGNISTDVIEVDALAGSTRTVTSVKRPLEVAPVGYSIDGARLFWVVVDSSGSNLWMERDGVVSRVGELSPGRTKDWSLSPDGSRLAFVDILGASSRNYVGRTLTIASATITTLPATGNQLGTAWRPGALLPEFGGPGGSLQLSEPSSEAAYIRPERWSPLGDLVVATVFAEGSDRYAPLTQAIEIGGTDRRELVTDVQGASFLGWVRDLPHASAQLSELETTAWQ